MRDVGRAPVVGGCGLFAALLDLGEVLGTTSLGALLPDPAVVFTFVFAALWFRALYGSTARILLFSVGIALGVAASLLLWPLVPGRGTPPSVEHILLGGLPSVFLTVTVSRYLALGLFAREQAQRRDTARSSLGRELLGITERTAIHRSGHACARELCAATRSATSRPASGRGSARGTCAHDWAATSSPC